MPRRVGRYTKYETAELTRMFSEGYSVYKICRNLNRSQNSVRNNLIKLRLLEGEITPRRYKTELKTLKINNSLASRTLNCFLHLIFLSILTLVMLINPLLNPLEMFIEGILIILILKF